MKINRLIKEIWVKKSFIFSLAILSVLITLVLADFQASVTPTSTDAGLVNQTFNFTINATSGNITQLNITLPPGFTFISGSNGTTASASLVNFTNISNILIWSNLTAQGFIDNNTKEYFWFNASISKIIYGTKNFNVSAINVTGDFDSYNISVNVERTVWSTRDEFYVKPVEIFLNYSNIPTAYNQTITIVANSSNSISIDVLVNDSSRLSENYTQSNTLTTCKNDFVIIARNSTGNGNTVYSLSPGSSANFTLAFNLSSSLRSCKPGRYYTNNFIIRNATNSAENLSISVQVDLPISSNNLENVNLPYVGIASFNGELPANATTYHSYYFNTSEVENATSVYINISGWESSQDVDLFLFDSSGNLLSKSIDKTGTSESLFYNFLPSSPTMYEIRLYGNSTSPITYQGNVIFSTLNSTSRSFDFGVRNVSTLTNQEFVLNNIGNLTLSNVQESKDLYHVNRFSDNKAKNFTFLVPDSTVTSKLKISLNWTGASNYSLYLYNPSGSLVASSINKYPYANVSNAMQEEYVETASITKGVWRAEVKNNTPITDSYTLTIYQYVYNASSWIATNYSTMTFNRTGLSNYTSTVNLTLTVPNNSMDGLYEGYIRYTSSSNQLINIPITINVTTPMLVVNNTLESTTFTLDENYGFNLTRSVTFQVNNTGFYDMIIDITNSSGILTCNAVLTSSCSGSYTNFTFNSFSGIGSYNYQNLTVNVTFNSSLPQGAYDGWIFINATNETENLSSHPYRTFNLTFRLNLTNALIVRTTSATSADGDNIVNLSSTPENVTVNAIVSYINGTVNITDLYLNWTDPTDLTKNFTGVWLIEPNVSYRYPVSGSLKIYNGTNPIYYNDIYSINVTIPDDASGMPGGVYAVYVNVSHKRDSFSYSGYGDGAYITVNNTGLYMELISYPSSLSNGTSGTVNVSIKNYGALAASSAKIKINLGSLLSYSSTSTNCPSPTTGQETTFSLSAFNSTGCWVAWNVSAGQTAGTSVTTINGTSDRWFGNLSFSTTITKPSEEGGEGGATPTMPTYVADLEFSKAETLVLVQQNSSNVTEVQVNNTGNISQDITFRIENINPTWYTINASSATLAPRKTAGFKITFTVGDVESKDYTGKYNVTSVSKTITKDFTLRVVPALAKQIQINDSLLLYKTQMVALEEEINQSKQKGVNVTLAEAKLRELKSLIERAEDYINHGDYFSANQLLTDIKSLIDQVKQELEAAKEIKAKESRKKTFMWIGVGAGVIVVVVLVYLFWPVKGYQPGKYTWKEESVWDKLKIDKLKEKWSKIEKRK